LVFYLIYGKTAVCPKLDFTKGKFLEKWLNPIVYILIGIFMEPYSFIKSDRVVFVE